MTAFLHVVDQHPDEQKQPGLPQRLETLAQRLSILAELHAPRVRKRPQEHSWNILHDPGQF